MPTVVGVANKAIACKFTGLRSKDAVSRFACDLVQYAEEGVE